MRKMLFLLLLFPLVASAQRDDWDLAYQKNTPDSLTRPIHLPERDYNPYFSYYDTMRYESAIRVVVIREDSIYRKLFWRYTYTNDSLKKYKKEGVDEWWYNWMVRHHIDSVPKIDFSKNELLMYAACAQCLAHCKHGQGYSPCHRNACSFRESWFIREKKQANKITPASTIKTVSYKSNGMTDTSRIWVNLPDMYLSDLRKFFEEGTNSSYNYVVGTDSLYYRIFSHIPKDSLPVIDFIKQELRAYISCIQCGGVPKGVEKFGQERLEKISRHRNACRYYSSWFVRDKKNIRGSVGAGAE